MARTLETSTSVGDIPLTVSTAYSTITTDEMKAGFRGSQFDRNNYGVLGAIRNRSKKGIYP